MSYCDLNPKLFEPFTSVKKKIVPALTDDWEIVPESYNRNVGFGLSSEKLDQYVQDIDLRRFLRFCKEQNLTIEGLKLKDKLIVGSDRSVYTEQMYNDWQTKYQSRVEQCTDIEPIPGWVYKTVCGKEIVYFGSNHIVRVNSAKSHLLKSHINDYVLPKKSTKKYFFSDFTQRIADNGLVPGNLAVQDVEKSKLKITTPIRQLMTEEEVNEFMKKWAYFTHDILYYSEHPMPKDVELAFIPTEEITRYVKTSEFLIDGQSKRTTQDTIVEPTLYSYTDVTKIVLGGEFYRVSRRMYSVDGCRLNALEEQCFGSGWGRYNRRTVEAQFNEFMKLAIKEKNKDEIIWNL